MEYRIKYEVMNGKIWEDTYDLPVGADLLDWLNKKKIGKLISIVRESDAPQGKEKFQDPNDNTTAEERPLNLKDLKRWTKEMSTIISSQFKGSQYDNFITMTFLQYLYTKNYYLHSHREDELIDQRKLYLDDAISLLKEFLEWFMIPPEISNQIQRNDQSKDPLL